MKETGLRIYAIGSSVVEQRHAMLPVVGTSRALVVSPDRGANHTTKISYRFGGSPVVLYGNPWKSFCFCEKSRTLFARVICFSQSITFCHSQKGYLRHLHKITFYMYRRLDLILNIF